MTGSGLQQNCIRRGDGILSHPRPDQIGIPRHRAAHLVGEAIRPAETVRMHPLADSKADSGL